MNRVAFLAFALASSAPPSARPQSARVDHWRESLEIDRPREVVEEAFPLVSAGGELAKDGRAIALAARALTATGEGPRAERLLAEARPAEDTRGFVEVARARLRLERDELEAARELLLGSRGELRHPDLPEAWLLAGRALSRSGEIAAAAPLFERFLALAPLDAEAPSAWHALAQAAIQRGEPGRAAELRAQALASAQWQDFFRARRLQVREKPDEPLPRLGIAELYLAVSEHERARDAAREIAARWPDFCRGHEALGRAELGLRHLDLARAALERATSCDPSSARAHLELARVLAASGDEEGARARYARYRELGGLEPLGGR